MYAFFSSKNSPQVFITADQILILSIKLEKYIRRRDS